MKDYDELFRESMRHLKHEFTNYSTPSYLPAEHVIERVVKYIIVKTMEYKPPAEDPGPVVMEQHHELTLREHFVSIALKEFLRQGHPHAAKDSIAVASDVIERLKGWKI